MKITSTTACVVATIIPMVATFAPGSARNRPVWDLKAKASPDVISAYQAYKRAKPQLKTNSEAPFTTDLPIPEIPTQTIIEAPPVSVSPPIQSSLPDSIDAAKDSISNLPTTAEQFSAQFNGLGDSIEAAKDSISNLPTTAGQFSAQFNGIGNYLKEKQELAAQAAAERASSIPSKIPTLGEMLSEGLTSRRATFTETSISSPEGKVPTLAEYILGGFQSPTSSIDTLADSKARFALLVENTYALFGQSAPENIEMNLPDGMTPETAAAVAVGGVGLLLIAGTQNQGNPSSTVKVEEGEQEGALFDLTTDAKKMAAQLEKLSQETKDLRKELLEAQEKISRKELEISKEKFKTADGELTWKRELERLRTKLQESEERNKALEQQLAASARVQPETKIVDDVQPKSIGVSLPPAPAPRPAAPAPVPKVAPEPEPILAKEKAPAPKKKSPPGPKGSAVKVASPVEAESPAPETKKAKAKSTGKATAKKALPEVASAEWSSLSRAAVSRKTVKELTEYLSSKGVETNDSDGKPLKKDMLVDAVMAL